jgi:hypothetical protein
MRSARLTSAITPVKQARESLDEVKALTECEDQKATRLLTIVTIFVALAGFIFTRLADLYPYRAPIRDITTIHPMTPSEGLRNREGERFRSFEVDDQLELGRLFDGEIGGLCAFQYFVGVGHCAAKKIGNIWSVQHQQMMGQTGHTCSMGVIAFFIFAKIRFQFSL